MEKHRRLGYLHHGTDHLTFLVVSALTTFLQARDCLNLWHIYLTKKEIETRHVKNRTFAGVDIKSLDLIPSKFIPPVTADHTGATANTEDAQAASGVDSSSR